MFIWMNLKILKLTSIIISSPSKLIWGFSWFWKYWNLVSENAGKFREECKGPRWWGTGNHIYKKWQRVPKKIELKFFAQYLWRKTKNMFSLHIHTWHLKTLSTQSHLLVSHNWHQAVFFPANPWTLFAGNSLCHRKSKEIWTKMSHYFDIIEHLLS